MKNRAILRAGKTKPTSGTRIAGKNAAVIFYFLKSTIYNCLLYTKICKIKY